MGAEMTRTDDGWAVTCEEHNLARTVETRLHAVNIVRIHDRRDHPGETESAATLTHPALDVSLAAAFVLAAHDLGHDDRAYQAVLGVWEALTGLNGTAAYDYAAALMKAPQTTAHVPPM